MCPDLVPGQSDHKSHKVLQSYFTGTGKCGPFKSHRHPVQPLLFRTKNFMHIRLHLFLFVLIKSEPKIGGPHRQQRVTTYERVLRRQVHPSTTRCGRSFEVSIRSIERSLGPYLVPFPSVVRECLRGVTTNPHPNPGGSKGTYFLVYTYERCHREDTESDLIIR